MTAVSVSGMSCPIRGARPIELTRLSADGLVLSARSVFEAEGQDRQSALDPVPLDVRLPVGRSWLIVGRGIRRFARR